MNPRTASTALVAILFAGCQQTYPVVPVSGEVLLDGQPLGGAQVGFEPLRSGEGVQVGPGSYAKTDDQGKFRLKAVDGREGAVVGQHLVWIRTVQYDPVATGKVVAREKLPKRYHDNSELRISVPEKGTDSIKLDLQSKRK